MSIKMIWNSEWLIGWSFLPSRPLATNFLSKTHTNNKKLDNIICYSFHHPKNMQINVSWLSCNNNNTMKDIFWLDAKKKVLVELGHCVGLFAFCWLVWVHTTARRYYAYNYLLQHYLFPSKKVYFMFSVCSIFVDKNDWYTHTHTHTGSGKMINLLTLVSLQHPAVFNLINVHGLSYHHESCKMMRRRLVVLCFCYRTFVLSFTCYHEQECLKHSTDGIVIGMRFFLWVMWNCVAGEYES